MHFPKSSKKPPASSNAPAAVADPEVFFEFEAIGTKWWIGIYEPVGADVLAGLKEAVAGRVERFDKTYSRFRDDSMVAAMARQAGQYGFPVGGRIMLQFYRKLYDLTDGAVTPLVGQLLSDAGYDAEYSLRPKDLKPVPAWDDVMVYRDDVLTLKQPALLDFGAVGKGFLVERVARLLRGAGVRRFCVDASGDMLFEHPDQYLRVGLENPDDSDQVIGVVDLADKWALCGSAGNRRAWAGFHHIMDPRSRTPAKGVKAVWVMSRQAMEADGLTTALFFVSPQALTRNFSFEFLILHEDGRIEHSHGFPAQLFT